MNLFSANLLKKLVVSSLLPFLFCWLDAKDNEA